VSELYLDFACTSRFLSVPVPPPPAPRPQPQPRVLLFRALQLGSHHHIGRKQLLERNASVRNVTVAAAARPSPSSSALSSQTPPLERGSEASHGGRWWWAEAGGMEGADVQSHAPLYLQ
jgi:hypothetical protein